LLGDDDIEGLSDYGIDEEEDNNVQNTYLQHQMAN